MLSFLSWREHLNWASKLNQSAIVCHQKSFKPIMWFGTGVACYHLSVVNSRQSQFNAVDYFISCPTRSKVWANKSIAIGDLGKENSLRITTYKNPTQWNWERTICLWPARMLCKKYTLGVIVVITITKAALQEHIHHLAPRLALYQWGDQLFLLTANKLSAANNGSPTQRKTREWRHKSSPVIRMPH